MIDSPKISLLGLPPTRPPATWGDESVMNQVAEVLRGAGLSAEVHVTVSAEEALQAARGADLVFPNGRWVRVGAGEERLFVELLEERGIPFLGSSPEGQRAANKSFAKERLSRNGVPTPRYETLPNGSQPAALDFPVMVKPDRSCESIGVVQAHSQEELDKAVVELQAAHGGRVIVEEWCREREFTVAVIGNDGGRHCFPVEVTLPGESLFLDEQLKLDYPAAQLLAVEEDDLRDRLAGVAEAAAAALQLRDWARIDVLLGPTGELFVIDVNTLPGLVTDPVQPSFLPVCLSRCRGMTWNESVLAVVGTALHRIGAQEPPPVRAARQKLQGPSTPTRAG